MWLGLGAATHLGEPRAQRHGLMPQGAASGEEAEMQMQESGRSGPGPRVGMGAAGPGPVSVLAGLCLNTLGTTGPRIPEAAPAQ